MKHGKAPTRRQKQAIYAAGFLANEWYVVKNLANELHVKNRFTDKVKVIPLREGERNAG